MKFRRPLAIFIVLIFLCMFISAANAAIEGGYHVTSTLWIKAVLDVPGFPVGLKWKMITAANTSDANQVISGYFYADPDDFAYGSQYNPEVFVKIFIATNGWCNIAFNHVTVDPVKVYSDHNFSGSALQTQTGTATLSNRLVEHQYNGVIIDYNLEPPQDDTEIINTYTSDLWAEANIYFYQQDSSTKMLWKTGGVDTNPSGDRVIWGYFYAPGYMDNGSIHNPEMFVKIYISKNGWANIAFNHVTVGSIDVYSAHHYSGHADHSGTATLDNRLVEHQYEGVSTSAGQEEYDITASNTGNGRIYPCLFGNDNNPSELKMSVPCGGSQTYVLEAGSNSYVKDVKVDGISVGDSKCLDYYTVNNVSESTVIEAIFGECVVGCNPLGGLNARDVCVSGNYAYVAGEESGFSVVEISDPVNPDIVGWLFLEGRASAVSVHANYAYVLGQKGHLALIDITDPENPAIAGEVDITGMTSDLYICGEYAYVKKDDCGLTILDINDPTNPTVAGSIDAPLKVTDVFVSGSRAYYIIDNAFQIVDISDPSSPVVVGQNDEINASHIAVSGNYAYLAKSYGSFQVIDITDPANPAFIGSGNFDQGFISGISVFGDYAYVKTVYSYMYRSSYTIAMVDITNPSKPNFSGIMPGTGTGDNYNVSASGSYAYVAAESLNIVDISNPSNLNIIGSVGEPIPVRCISGSDNFLYIAQGERGLLVMDITNPVNPTILGHVDIFGIAFKVFVSGNYAYVLYISPNSITRLALIDISDPENPAIAGEVDMPGASDVFVSGSYAYVTIGTILAGKLTILNITDPANPVIVGNAGTPTEAVEVAVSGNYAYVGDWYTGLHVVDVTDPANPAIVWNQNNYGSVFGDIAVSGKYAYITQNDAQGEDAFEVWDITCPSNPGIISALRCPYADEIHIYGDYACITSYYEARVYDITAPANPVYAGRVFYYMYSYYPSAYISEHYAYIGGTDNGLLVVDLDNVCDLQ